MRKILSKKNNRSAKDGSPTHQQAIHTANTISNDHAGQDLAVNDLAIKNHPVSDQKFAQPFQPLTYHYCKKSMLGAMALSSCTLKHYLQQDEDNAKECLLPCKVHGEAKVFAEAMVGIQHRQPNNNLPCQDAVKVSLRPRPILVLCDGAGSAAVSDIGATQLTIQLSRLCQSIEPMLSSYLDQEHVDHVELLVRVIIRHAMGVLQDLSHQHRRDVRDFRSTLNFAIVGTHHTLWIRIGDGEIIQEQVSLNPQTNQYQVNYQCLGEPIKGEFANQTVFIDNQLRLENVQWGVIDSTLTSGLILLSDGAAEKLVSTNRDRVSGQLTAWLEQLRNDQIKVKNLYQRFYGEEFLTRSVGDDRAIALYSKDYHPKDQLLDSK